MDNPIGGCRNCKEDFSYDNIFSKQGLSEAEISGLCEVCFDNITYDIEDGIESICEIFTDEVTPVQTIEGCFLAGGAIRKAVDLTDEVKDLDLFFTSSDAKEKAIEYFDSREMFQRIFTCPAGELISYVNSGSGLKVQIVAKHYYNTPSDAIASFDITACCAAWDGVDVYTNRRFISDVLNKRIYLHRVTYPNATMRRMTKYRDKGYTLTHSAINDFVESVNSMELTDENTEFYVD